MNQQESPNLIISGFKKIGPQVRAAFLGALLFGVFSQGMGLFNKFSHHDDVGNLFDLGTTISSGRWALQIVEWAEKLFYGTGNTSLPLFNGMLSILCIGAASGLLVWLLKIRNKVYCALLGCVMVSFPVVTAAFAYMFTSHPYMICLLMMTGCACLICAKTPWWAKLFAAVLGGTAVGIYQAYLPVLLIAILCYDIQKLADENGLSGAFFKRIGIQVLCLLGVMLVYLAGNRFFLNKYQVELSSYQGIDQAGNMTIQAFLDRCGRAYGEFFNPTRQVFADMYPGALHTIYLLMLVMDGLLVVRMIVMTAKKSIGQAAVLALMFALIPLGCNLIYIMAENIHGLMVYGQVMQVVLFIMLFDRVKPSSIQWKRAVSVAASAVLAVMAVMYARYDNQCYLKDAIHQQEAISYYTTLITRIKSQKGYRPDMGVYFANAEVKTDDPTVYNMDELDFIRLNPYWHNSMEYLHAMTWYDFMMVWCGNDFSRSWRIELESLPEVQAMPSYPADGSIQVIEDTVIVKF